MQINRLSPWDLLPLALLATLPGLLDAYTQGLVVQIMIYAVLALALELLVGTTGLVCFCQAAFFGIGAYAVVIMAADSEPVSVVWLLLVAIGSSAIFALAVGFLSLRTSGVYFIMVTLAFGQMAYHVIHDTAIGGGTDGIYLSDKPALGSWLSFDQSLHLYYFVLAGLSLVFVFLMLLLQSRFGRALAGIKQNEQRMRAAGFETYRYKLAAFVVSGALSGFAGFLFAIKDGFANPQLLSWHLSGAILVMIILGGLGSLRGAVFGAFAYVALEEFFKAYEIWGEFARHWHLGLGLTIILSVALLPKGLAGLAALMQRRLATKREVI